MLTKLIKFRESVAALPFWVCGINALIDRHQTIETEFHELIKNLVSKDINYEYREGPLKNFERIKQKAIADDGRLQDINDVLRSMFVVNDFSSLKKIDETISKFTKGYNIPYERRNKFIGDDAGQFRAIVYKFNFGNQCMAEVQLTVKPFGDIYNQTHERYEKIRTMRTRTDLSPEETNLLNRLETENKEDHKQAWAACKNDYQSIYAQELAKNP